MRNVIKTSAAGRDILDDHPRADLILAETDQFYRMFKSLESEEGTTDAMLKVMSIAYEMGVAVGYRNAKKWQSE